MSAVYPNARLRRPAVVELAPWMGERRVGNEGHARRDRGRVGLGRAPEQGCPTDERRPSGRSCDERFDQLGDETEWRGQIEPLALNAIATPMG